MFGAKQLTKSHQYMMALSPTGSSLLEDPYTSVILKANTGLTIQSPICYSSPTTGPLYFIANNRVYTTTITPTGVLSNMWTVSQPVGSNYPIYFPTKVGSMWAVVADTGAGGFKIYTSTDLMTWTASWDLPNKGVGMYARTDTAGVWLGRGGATGTSFLRIDLSDGELSPAETIVGGIGDGETVTEGLAHWNQTAVGGGFGGHVMMFITDGGYAYYSMNNGVNWARIDWTNRILPLSTNYIGAAFSARPIASDSTVFFYSTSAPGAVSWVQVSLPWPGINAICGSTTMTDSGLVGRTYARFTSTLGVTTWRYTDKGLPEAGSSTDWVDTTLESICPGATTLWVSEHGLF